MRDDFRVEGVIGSNNMGRLFLVSFIRSWAQTSRQGEETQRKWHMYRIPPVADSVYGKRAPCKNRKSTSRNDIS